MDAPHITLFSTPLISTWVFDETHRILFDVGDGVTAMLDSRIHKVRLAAITHTHRDHCSGLMQFLNLRGGAGDFKTVYPEASGAGRALANFLSTFDARSTGKVVWYPVGPGDELKIEPERHILRTFATEHYVQVDPPRALSLGYQIVRSVDKVKQEFRGLPQTDLDEIRTKHGKQYLTETVEDILFTITGDTTPMNPDTFRGSRVLMHECTFMDLEERQEMANRGHPHTCLEEALDIAKAANVGRLGLYHISRRYDDDLVIAKVKDRCAKIGLECPVSVALPGRLYDDFFTHTTWQGSMSTS